MVLYLLVNVHTIASMYTELQNLLSTEEKFHTARAR